MEPQNVDHNTEAGVSTHMLFGFGQSACFPPLPRPLAVTWLAQRCRHIPGASSSTPRQAGSKVTHLSIGLASPTRGSARVDVFSQPRPDTVLYPHFLIPWPVRRFVAEGSQLLHISAMLISDSRRRGEQVHTEGEMTGRNASVK